MPIIDNLQQVKSAITTAEIKYNRPLGLVQLLAVSKGQSVAAIKTAAQCGQLDFGESYVQEAVPKIKALAHLPLKWHFIGPIQSNKTQLIAANFDWIHSISREKIALLLNNARPLSLKPLQVCIQVNLTRELSKSGITMEGVSELAQYIQQLPQLQLRGLMLIPPIFTDHLQQYDVFLQLHNLLQSLNQQLNLTLDTLSMGMSKDFITAIKAGSTMIRIGRSIFC